MIPLNLVHIVPPRERLAPELQDNLARQAQANPAWKHIVFTDAEALAFIKHHCAPRAVAALERIDPAYGPARSDLMRYLIMYQIGGVYLDSKSGLSRPLDDIVHPDDEFIVSQWHKVPGEVHNNWGLHAELAHVPGGEFQNWVIVTRAGHPFLAAVIESVVSNIENYSPQAFGVGKHGTLRLTGPIAYTLAIAPLLEQHAYRRVFYVEAGFLYAANGDHERHELLAPLHYTRLRHPIVIPSKHAKAWSRMSYYLKRSILIQQAKFRQWKRRRLYQYKRS